jgi:hypothetical protein
MISRDAHTTRARFPTTAEACACPLSFIRRGMPTMHVYFYMFAFALYPAFLCFLDTFNGKPSAGLGHTPVSRLPRRMPRIAIILCIIAGSKPMPTAIVCGVDSPSNDVGSTSETMA